ncbi:claudin-15-like [Betta splendens]|uniref:Claudin n=1 Tax=Betta splendens TaxID=158456 RepID=A0A6P7PHH9_BETSP|nr:claudin-15-like [Betta splendens]
MKGIIEVISLFLGFVSWVMVFVALQNQYWRVSTQDGSVILTSAIFENLWMSCASDSAAYNCREFPSLFALPGYVQASRALMITSIVLGKFGLVATLVGMRCSKVGGENYTLKGKIAASGGLFFLLQGICTMITISWYAANITRDFFNELYPGIKYEFGEALYIGWCSATLAICGGSLLMCSSQLKTPREKTSYSHRRAEVGRVLSTVSTPHSVPSSFSKKVYV